MLRTAYPRVRDCESDAQRFGKACAARRRAALPGRRPEARRPGARATSCALRWRAAWTSSSCATRMPATTSCCAGRRRSRASSATPPARCFVVNDRPDLALAGRRRRRARRPGRRARRRRARAGRRRAARRPLDAHAEPDRRRSRRGRRLHRRRPRARDADEARPAGRRTRPRPLRRGERGGAPVVRDRRDRRGERRGTSPRPGARRVAVVRAIAEAADPRDAAQAIRVALGETATEPVVSGARGTA